MTRHRICLIACKQFILLLLCVCLISGIYSQQIKGTVSYITSLSVICVNTFAGDADLPPEPSTPPMDPEDPGTPPTGDGRNLEWYVIGMLTSIAALMLLWKADRHKERSKKNRR